MVSRGGRSKGCSNCRRRRVKCDETRPVCIRCKKRGLECDGPRDTTWINSNAHPTLHPQNALSSRGIPKSLSIEPFADDLCIAYTRKYLLRGGTVEMACNRIPWASDSHKWDPKVTLLRNAILSLSITFFGNQHGQDKMESRGYKMYGDVLRQLNTHLMTPQLQTCTETILAILTCMLLEIFLPTGQNNFLKHVRGIEAILEMRGPPPLETPDCPIIFHNIRILCIVGALAEGRATVWAKQEYKSIAPQYTDESMLIKHDIWNILSDATVQLSERRRIVEVLDDPPCHTSLQALLASAQASLDKLECVHAQLERYNKNLQPKHTVSSGSRLPIANYAVGTAYMLFSAVYICVLKILNSLEPLKEYNSLRKSAAMRMLDALELEGFEKQNNSAESNTIVWLATKTAWETLKGYTSHESERVVQIEKLARVVTSSENRPKLGHRESINTPEGASWCSFPPIPYRIPNRSAAPAPLNICKEVLEDPTHEQVKKLYSFANAPSHLHGNDFGKLEFHMLSCGNAFRHF